MKKILEEIIKKTSADKVNYKKILEISRKATSEIYKENCIRVHARTARLKSTKIFTETKVYLLKTYTDEARKIITNLGITDNLGSDEAVYSNILRPFYLYVVKKNK